MSGYQVPGPFGLNGEFEKIDAGTLALTRMPAPGTLGLTPIVAAVQPVALGAPNAGGVSCVICQASVVRNPGATFGSPSIPFFQDLTTKHQLPPEHGFNFRVEAIEYPLYRPSQNEQQRSNRNRVFRPDDRYVNALAIAFDTSPEAIQAITVTEYADFADQHRAVAVTRVNAIWVAVAGDRFFASEHLTLHEYYHVLAQWNTGDLTVARYLVEWARQGFDYNKIRYEVEANRFADKNVQRYRSLLGRKE